MKCRKNISLPESFKQADLFLIGSLFDNHFLHFHTIGIADADEINARGISMKMLHATHLVEVEDLLSHGIEHADLRGLTQFNSKVTIRWVGVDAKGL